MINQRKKNINKLLSMQSYVKTKSITGSEIFLTGGDAIYNILKNINLKEIRNL